MDSFRKKLAIEVGIGALIILPLLGGIVYFSSQVGKFGDQIAAARRELFSRTASLSSLAMLRSAYNDKTRRYLETLHQVVPVKDQLINLARDFQSLASQSRLSSSFTFLGEEPAAGGSLGSLSFRLNLGGTLTDLLAFVGKFEKFRHLSALSDFSMTRGAETSQMVAQWKVYYR